MLPQRFSDAMKAKRLTNVLVERITPPSSGRDEHFDAVVTGLALRVTESGARSWSYIYRLDRRNRRITLGKYWGVRKYIRANLIMILRMISFELIKNVA